MDELVELKHSHIKEAVVHSNRKEEDESKQKPLQPSDRDESNVATHTIPCQLLSEQTHQDEFVEVKHSNIIEEIKGITSLDGAEQKLIQQTGMSAHNRVSECQKMFN